MCRDILDYQFLDEPESDPVYGSRSEFGYPQIATLTAGGDDVEFLWLIMYCILQFFKNNPCQEQITRSQGIIDSELFYNSLDYVIKNALIRGITAAGPGFKLFVTGYAQFFNGTSTQCDNTCFSYWDPGCNNSIKLDQPLRQQLNKLALNLNQKIQDVVQNNAQWDVEYVSYDDQFEGHRFCEEGNIEPDDNNPNSKAIFWFISPFTPLFSVLLLKYFPLLKNLSRTCSISQVFSPNIFHYSRTCPEHLSLLKRFSQTLSMLTRNMLVWFFHLNTAGNGRTQAIDDSFAAMLSGNNNATDFYKAIKTRSATTWATGLDTNQNESAAYDLLFNVGDTSDPSVQSALSGYIRIFHPTGPGIDTIEDQIFNAFPNWPPADPPPVGAQGQSTTSALPPSSKTAPSPVAPSATPPPYATGTCSLHVDEYQDCLDDASNLYAVVTIKDNNKNVIGQTPTNDSYAGAPINADDPYFMTSKLTKPLVIVGEHENDYIRFTLGSRSWTSRDTQAPYFASNGGWNPRDGPVCGQRYGDEIAVSGCF